MTCPVRLQQSPGWLLRGDTQALAPSPSSFPALSLTAPAAHPIPAQEAAGKGQGPLRRFPSASEVCDVLGEERPARRRHCCFTGGMLESPATQLFDDGGCLFLATVEVPISAHLAPPASRPTRAKRGMRSWESRRELLCPPCVLGSGSSSSSHRPQRGHADSCALDTRNVSQLWGLLLAQNCCRLPPPPAGRRQREGEQGPACPASRPCWSRVTAGAWPGITVPG